MKVCQFIKSSSIGIQKRLGIVYQDEPIVIDPNAVWIANFESEKKSFPVEKANRVLPPNLNKLLKYATDPIDLLYDTYGLYTFFKKIGVNKTRSGLPLSYELNKVSLDSPITNPPQLKDFFSHKGHIENVFKKRGSDLPKGYDKRPVYFNCSTQNIYGPNKLIPWPSYVRYLDYELELALVMGKGGKNIKKHEALDHIFGLTILNDVSARDMQKLEIQMGIGPAKSKDFCYIIGPYITTFDEFDHKEPELLMQAKINNEVWSKGSSKSTLFDFKEIIEYASLDEWILPGAVLGLGAIENGCGFELSKWIKPGDTVSLEIEKIGILTNKVGAPKSDAPWKEN